MDHSILVRGRKRQLGDASAHRCADPAGRNRRCGSQTCECEQERRARHADRASDDDRRCPSNQLELNMSRIKILILWLFITTVSPILLISMLIQALCGSTARAMGMAVSFDECGNCLFGGDATETI